MFLALTSRFPKPPHFFDKTIIRNEHLVRLKDMIHTGMRIVDEEIRKKLSNYGLKTPGPLRDCQSITYLILGFSTFFFVPDGRFMKLCRVRS